MNHFNDCGGSTPAGSNMNDAPWNRGDLEITEDNLEQAYHEVYAVMDWACDQTISYDNLSDMIETVLNRNELVQMQEIMEQMEIIYDDKGTSAMLTMMPEEKVELLRISATDWVEERADTIARRFS